MRFYTTQVLGPNQELTPEGYLLCKSVPIARTGVMLYAAGEVPVTPRNGVVRIQREATEVFHQTTIASFEGKPVCLDHPTEDVNPENWSRLAVGVVLNVRRGTGVEDDFLLADLLLTNRTAIQQVRDGLREVSCGYDADYEELSPGQGRQTNIIGNHLALVEKGRCGARCAIGDSMKKLKFIDRLRAAFKARDEAEHEKVLEEAVKDADTEETEEEKKKREAEEESKKTSDKLTKVLDSLQAIETRLDKLESGKTGDGEDDPDNPDQDGKTMDSVALVNEMQDTIARVEILSPGLQIPTFDAKAKPGKTRDGLCQLKRKALAKAFEGSTRDAITPFVGATPDFGKLTCDQVSNAFLGASEIVRRENNLKSKVTFDGRKKASDVANSISEINRQNAAFWSRSN